MSRRKALSTHVSVFVIAIVFVVGLSVIGAMQASLPLSNLASDVQSKISAMFRDVLVSVMVAAVIIFIFVGIKWR